MEKQLLNILTELSIKTDPSISLAQNISNILQEKEKIIVNLSQQITKYKCEEIKREKLIKTLQDKISQLSPNISNTGSNFMMNTEFKTTFEDFMASTLTNMLGWAIDKPFLFSKCTEDIFTSVNGTIQQQVNSIITQIAQTLKISHLMAEGKDLGTQIKLSLLKILQEHWEAIFPFREDSKNQYEDKQSLVPKELLEEINNQLLNEDYNQTIKQLHKICVYMTLQDKPWQFTNLNKGQIVKYSKKEHTCIDGWIKEGDEALVVLGGIIRDGHLHPNLKNYVIPLVQDQNEKNYQNLVFKIKQQFSQFPLIKPEIEMLKNSPEQNSQYNTFQNDVEMLPLRPVFIDQPEILVKNKSIEIMNNKENYSYALNKKSKKKDKLKFSMETSLNLPEKSPKNILRRHDQSIKNKKIEIQQVDEKIYLIREQCKAKKKSVTICKNTNEAEPLMPLKEKNVQELPMSKQINQRKKSKPHTSRKNSVGKIVSQNHMINDKENKQNTQSINNSKMKNKEKAYKDIIKEKLLDDKFQDKTQHSLNILFPKSRTDRTGKKQENRPLKIQNNANKLREKYIF